jgi:hypothetical protein
MTNTLKVSNMEGRNGSKVKNQFSIVTVENDMTVEYFQSYNSIIARKEYTTKGQIYLDKTYWDYSVTTGKYRNQFLGETKKETEAKIKSGEYILTDLN